MEFKGTVIITDPCYILRRENKLTEDDWFYCEYGESMDKLGIKTFITKDTEYGDWSCTTYDDSNKPIGKFCADAGLVSVFLLDEVRKYNPNIDGWIESHNWCVTKIEDFDGDIEIGYKEYAGELEVSVIGKCNINFYTKQTGF